MNPILSAFLILVFASCNGGSPVEPAPAPSAAPEETAGTNDDPATEVELRLDAAAESRGLEILWLELEDSRCPIGVNCVWAGQMVATLQVSQPGGDSAEIELVTRVAREPEPAQAFGQEFRLLDVEPHPKDGVTIDRSDYVATVEIRNP